MLFTTLLQLLLAPFALAEFLETYRHTKRSELHTRQETENCTLTPSPSQQHPSPIPTLTHN